jgi:hypothetical protein
MPESRNRDRCGACGTKLRYRAGALRFSRSLLFAHSRPVHSLPRSGSG